MTKFVSEFVSSQLMNAVVYVWGWTLVSRLLETPWFEFAKFYEVVYNNGYLQKEAQASEMY